MTRSFRAVLLLVLLAVFTTGISLSQTGNDEITLPLTDNVTYTVRPGDTLDTVGALFDVAPRCLAESSDLPQGARLQIGDSLLIDISCPLYPRQNNNEPPPQVRFPREAPPESAGQGGGAGQQTYRVQPGDTLDTIAQELNISVVSLQLANNLTRPGELAIDMMLTIPSDAPPYGTYPAVDNPAPGQIYSVQIGESLDDIAQQFDVALRALETVNNINPGRNALPGTAIYIPENVPAYGADDEFDPAQVLGQGGATAGDFHVVQPRETLDSIAAFYNLSTTCLAEANTITQPRLLQPGTVLVIDESCPAYTGYNTRPTLQDAIAPADDTAEDTADPTTTNTEAESGEAIPLGERGDG